MALPKGFVFFALFATTLFLASTVLLVVEAIDFATNLAMVTAYLTVFGALCLTFAGSLHLGYLYFRYNQAFFEDLGDVLSGAAFTHVCHSAPPPV